MSHYHDNNEDALLPMSNRASEKQAFHPPISKEVYEPELKLSKNLKRPRNFIAHVLGLCCIISLIVLFTPSNIYSKFLRHLKPLPSPLSIEERVSQILSETPLIGTSSIARY